ncbi:MULTISPECIES: hypothetical protein, partial [unclassified Bradyrhizobium]|uniref:hypothetical protein n=1 Tax=unclassified Bradyrhizobium TaxID=2631580 RepID=UPI0028E7D44F
LVLLQNPDDLLFRKAAALHALVLVGPERTSNWIKPEGQGHALTVKITRFSGFPSEGEGEQRMVEKTVD